MVFYIAARTALIIQRQAAILTRRETNASTHQVKLIFLNYHQNVSRILFLFLVFTTDRSSFFEIKNLRFVSKFLGRIIFVEIFFRCNQTWLITKVLNQIRSVHYRFWFCSIFFIFEKKNCVQYLERLAAQ